LEEKKDKMRKLTKLTKKAQLSILNVVSLIILVIFMSIATYINADVLDPLILLRENNTLDALVMSFVIPMMWLAVIITIFVFASPQPRQPQY
jgi:hypothetical protein